jgi:hypothetical protein
MPTADEERDRRKRLAKVKSSKAVDRSKRLIKGSLERIARAKALIKGEPPKATRKRR